MLTVKSVVLKGGCDNDLGGHVIVQFFKNLENSKNVEYLVNWLKSVTVFNSILIPAFKSEPK